MTTAHMYVTPYLLLAGLLWGSAYLAWLSWRLWPKTRRVRPLSAAARRVLSGGAR